MKLYIDLSCFNRPFDNQDQERIRIETDAVFGILNRIMDRTDVLLWSWALSFENDKHPRPDRRAEIAAWEAQAEQSVGLSDKVEERVRQIAQAGISNLDALHLALAEEGRADVMLTCDDALVRRSGRLNLALRILNPVAYFEQVKADG
jgi:hypothetical protein